MTEIPVAPASCIHLDERKYKIEVELPGVSKEDIKLETDRTALYITFPRYNVSFTATLNLDHCVVPEKVKASFEEGLLKITAPLAEPLERKKVNIE